MPTIFYLQTKRNPAGIYVRFRDGKDVDAKAKTKYSVNPKDWNYEKHKLKHTRDDELKKLQLNLDNFENNLNNHHNNCVGKVSINSKWLKDFINPSIISEKIPSSLTEYFEYYKTEKGNQLTKASKTKLSALYSFSGIPL